MTPRQTEHHEAKQRRAEVSRARTLAWKIGGLNPARTDPAYKRYVLALALERAGRGK